LGNGRRAETVQNLQHPPFEALTAMPGRVIVKYVYKKDFCRFSRGAWKALTGRGVYPLFSAGKGGKTTNRRVDSPRGTDAFHCVRLP